jgi:phage tail-like protein
VVTVSDLVTDDPGLSVYFRCRVDAPSGELGDWTTCSGLGISFETVSQGDTATFSFMHHFPKTKTYTNVTLGRPISPSTDKVIAWLSAFSLLPHPTVAEITALDPDGKSIMTFNLYGVVPVKWTGPSFDASSLKIAEEQLELAYQGFL